jgi:hypothetical protein
MPVVEFDPCILAEPFHLRTRGMGCNRWRGIECVCTTDEEIALVRIADGIDVLTVVSVGGEFVTDELTKCRIVKRREHRLLVGRWDEDALVDAKGMDDRRGDRGDIPLLFLAEDGHRLRVEVDIAPAEAVAWCPCSR